MPGYNLREHGSPLPEEAEPIGFFDFLRKLSGEAPAVPRLWNVAVARIPRHLSANQQPPLGRVRGRVPICGPAGPEWAARSTLPLARSTQGSLRRAGCPRGQSPGGLA